MEEQDEKRAVDLLKRTFSESIGFLNEIDRIVQEFVDGLTGTLEIYREFEHIRTDDDFYIYIRTLKSCLQVVNNNVNRCMEQIDVILGDREIKKITRDDNERRDS